MCWFRSQIFYDSVTRCFVCFDFVLPLANTFGFSDQVNNQFSSQMFSGSVPRGCVSDRRTFPVVVPVDVEGVQQVVVIMSQQVQTSGSRLNDADDLTVKQQSTLLSHTHTGLNCVLTQSHFTNNKHCFKGQMPTKHCYNLKQKVLSL